jgi:predicted Zn-dependent protease
LGPELKVTKRRAPLFILLNIGAHIPIVLNFSALVNSFLGSVTEPGARQPLRPKTGGLLLCLVLVAGCALRTFGQAQDFVPLALHGPRSTDLMAQIDKHLRGDLRRGESPETWIGQVRLRQAAFLKRMVRAHAFVDNDSLQCYVERYFDRLVQTNALQEKSRLVLIMNSPESNAACYGSGVFIVTSGLLANMPDEASLAFILAHEIAHDELSHVQQTLRVLSRERESRNPGAAFARILLTDVNEDYIDAFRTTLYASAAMSRDHEMHADSLALSFICHAGYQASSAAHALSTLASLREADMNDLFASLSFNDFPFKEHWLNERLKVYHRKPANTFLWSFDSLRSHPQMERRIQSLSRYDHRPANATGNKAIMVDEEKRQRIATLMAFQSIEAAYQMSQYDIALFNLLRQLKSHPGNAYLVTRTAGILVDLFHAKNEGDLSVLSQFTSSLSDSERLVNNFLFNMSKEEVAELAYHFLNNRENFDPQNAAHYYLLWEACHLTSRDHVQAKVAATYAKRFGSDIQSFRMD